MQTTLHWQGKLLQHAPIAVALLPTFPRRVNRDGCPHPPHPTPHPQVVSQITDHLADMVPAAGSVRPPAFQHMDTLLRVAENRLARPTCVYPGALITAILAPIYGQSTYWAGCNSTQSYT